MLRLPTSFIPIALLMVGSACGKHETDAPEVAGPDHGTPTDTLALVVGHYKGLLIMQSWSMPDNQSFSSDTVILEVTIDTTLQNAINLGELEQHMVLNEDLSLTMQPGIGYGGATGHIVIGDSIVVGRSQGALSWSFSHSFKGIKLD